MMTYLFLCKLSKSLRVMLRSFVEQHFIEKGPWFQPFYKAGGYGIQEWIGLIGINEVKGSNNNVVDLPTQFVYKTLIEMVG